MCGGGKGQSQSQTSQTQSYAPNPQAAGYITNALQTGANAAQLPFNIPQAPVAGFSPQQQQAFDITGNAQGMALPYINNAANLFGQSAQGPNVSQFFNPFASAVTSQLNNIFGQQNVQNTGNLTQQAGGVGADRIAVGQANLANQQGLAAGQTLANLYAPSLSAAEQEQNILQGAGYGMGALGPAAQASVFQGANQLLGTGGLQQQLAQAQLNAPYQQQLARSAFPYQNANFLANITGALAPGLGGTTSGTGTTTQTPAQPSLFSQILGGGLAGAGINGQLNQQYGVQGGGPFSWIGNSKGASPGFNVSARGGRINPYADGGTIDLSRQEDGSYGYDDGGSVNLPPVQGDTYQRMLEMQQLRGDAGTNPFSPQLPSGLSGQPINVAPQSEVPTGQITAIHPNIPQLNLNPSSGGGGGGGGGGSPGVGDIISTGLKIAGMFMRRGGATPHKDFGGSVSGGGFPIDIHGLFTPSGSGSSGGAASSPAGTPMMSRPEAPAAPVQSAAPAIPSASPSPVGQAPAMQGAGTNPFSALFGGSGPKGSGGTFYGMRRGGRAGYDDGGDVPIDPLHREFLARHGVETASSDLSPTATGADIKAEGLGMVDPLGIPSWAAGKMSPDLGAKLEAIKQASPEGYGAGALISPFNDIPANIANKGIGLVGKAYRAAPATTSAVAGLGALGAGTAAAGDQPTGRPQFTDEDNKRLAALDQQIAQSDLDRAKYIKSKEYQNAPASGRNATLKTFEAKAEAARAEAAGMRTRMAEQQEAYDKAGDPISIRNPGAVAASRAGGLGLSAAVGAVGGWKNLPFWKAVLGGAGMAGLGAAAPTAYDLMSPEGTRARQQAEAAFSDPDFYKRVAIDAGLGAVEGGVFHEMGHAFGAPSQRKPAITLPVTPPAQAAAALTNQSTTLNLNRFVDKNGNVHWRDDRGYRRRPPANLAPGNIMPAEARGGKINPFGFADGGRPLNLVPASHRGAFWRSSSTPEYPGLLRDAVKDGAITQEQANRALSGPNVGPSPESGFGSGPLYRGGGGIRGYDDGGATDLDDPYSSYNRDALAAGSALGSGKGDRLPQALPYADVRLNEDTLGIGPNRGQESAPAPGTDILPGSAPGAPIDTVLNDQAVRRSGLPVPPPVSARSPYAPPQLPPSAAPTGAGAPSGWSPTQKDPGFIGSPWAALTAAGLGIMGGTSPFAGVNIGKGGLQGLQMLEQQRAFAQKDTTIEQASRRLEQEAKKEEDQYTRSTPYQQFEMNKPVPIGQHIDPTTLMPMTTYGTVGPDGKITPIDTSGVAGGVGEPGSASGLLGKDALDIMADSYIKGNTAVAQSMGFGKPGAVNRQRLWDTIAQKIKAQGGGGEDLAAARANFMAESAGARTAAIRGANIDMAVTEAQQTFPLGLEASRALPRGQFVPWNKAVQMFQAGTSSPELARFVTANQAIITAYSQAMSRTGANSVHAQDRAEQLLSTATSPESYETVLDQLGKEMHAAKLAPEAVRRQIESNITGKPVAAPVGGAPAPAAPAAAAPAGGATTTRTIGDKTYYKRNGTWYDTPG